MLPKPRRFALFAPDSPLFVNLLMGLKRGLEGLGMEVHAGWPLLSGRLLTTFLANYQPDVVFEINRARDQIIGCDRPFVHLSWMQDFQWNGTYIDKAVSGSDLTYLILPPDIYGIDPGMLGRWKYLWPGVDDAIFRPQPAARLWDVTLVGHMYGPIPPASLDVPLRARGAPCGSLAGLVERFLASDIRNDAAGVPEVRRFLVEHAARYGIDVSMDTLGSNLLFLMEEVLFRIKGRCRLADAMLDASRAVRFFGGVGWALWERYAPYYGGEVLDPYALASIYQASRLNAHNSPWPLHFRPLDTMASGGVALINRVVRPDVETLFYCDFEPGVHLLEYELATFTDTVHEALADPARLQRIGEAGARRTHERHTWHHRARQILADLDEGL